MQHFWILKNSSSENALNMCNTSALHKMQQTNTYLPVSTQYLYNEARGWIDPQPLPVSCEFCVKCSYSSSVMFWLSER